MIFFLSVKIKNCDNSNNSESFCVKTKHKNQ